MHIPDGYLSPATCTCLYGAAAPFWYGALRRVRSSLHTQAVPQLSVFAAFSFVVMMFNLPLPGGTTGHAVGMGVATVILGPAFSILAISMALFVQALFFGDGGLTTFGANCFNMAVVGSLAAYATYRLVSWGTALDSKRRAFAAGLAGYVAINCAALLAAIEFGIQPLYFRDASGAPLYAPYPLAISIPAMMLGHLTIAGAAEFILSAGLVRYLQRSTPSLLAKTAPELNPAPRSGRAPLRPLWAALSLLLILTPLGLLSVGSAWGEWSPDELKSLLSNQSSNPQTSPSGLQHFATLWNAPVPDYAPRFAPNQTLGYLLSAVLGVALIAVAFFLLQRMLGMTRRPRTFLESTVRHLLRAFNAAFFAEEIALRPGLLQTVDPRVKLVAFILLAAVALSAHTLWLLAAILFSGCLLAVRSSLTIQTLVRRLWLPVLLFTGPIASPALFLVDWGISLAGLRAVLFLVLRAEAVATLSFLLVQTTIWSRLLQAMRSLRVPASVVLLLSVAYRYLFVFLDTALHLVESRGARLLGKLNGSHQRQLAAANAGVLLEKSMLLSAEVDLAMRARGFCGTVQSLDDEAMRSGDWLLLALVATLSFGLYLAAR